MPLFGRCTKIIHLLQECHRLNFYAKGLEIPKNRGLWPRFRVIYIGRSGDQAGSEASIGVINSRTLKPVTSTE